MSKNIVASCDWWRNGGSPCIVICNELIGSPISIGNALIDEARLADLEPLQRSFVYSLARSVAIREVVDDRPFVRNRPWSPLKIDLAPSSDGRSCLSIGCINVADYVCCGIGGGCDETIIKIFWDLPPYSDRCRCDVLKWWIVSGKATSARLATVYHKTFKQATY